MSTVSAEQIQKRKAAKKFFEHRKEYDDVKTEKSLCCYLKGVNLKWKKEKISDDI